jgi:hypothetical protein
MGLLILILEFFSYSPSQDGTCDPNRWWCGAAGKENEGDDWGSFIHGIRALASLLHEGNQALR